MASWLDWFIGGNKGDTTTTTQVTGVETVIFDGKAVTPEPVMATPLTAPILDLASSDHVCLPVTEPTPITVISVEEKSMVPMDTQEEQDKQEDKEKDAAAMIAVIATLKQQIATLEAEVAGLRKDNLRVEKNLRFSQTMFQQLKVKHEERILKFAAVSQQAEAAEEQHKRNQRQQAKEMQKLHQAVAQQSKKKRN